MHAVHRYRDRHRTYTGQCHASGRQEIRLPTDGEKATPPHVLRIGAVAYAPSAVTVFENLRRYFAKSDLPVDYVLYSNYDALVDALRDGHVDIAWNTPLAHARYHLLGNGQSLVTLVMCDVFLTSLLQVARLQGGRGSRRHQVCRARPSHLAAASAVPRLLSCLFTISKGRECRLDKVKFLRSGSKKLDLRGNPKKPAPRPEGSSCPGGPTSASSGSGLWDGPGGPQGSGGGRPAAGVDFACI